MATLAQLENALRKADAAGNAEDARRLAAEIRRLRTTPTGESRAQLEQRAAQEFAPVDPTEGMSTGERLGAGFAGRATGLLRGAQQVGADIVSAAPGALGRYGEREAGRLAQEEAQTRQLDVPLRTTGAGFVGGLGADVASLVAPGVGLRGTQAARAFLPQTFRGGVAQGAAIGAAQPLAPGESRLLNVLFGAGGGAVGGAATRLLGGGRRVFTGRQAGLERQAGEILEEFSQDPAAVRRRLSQPSPEVIPGVSPATAEVAGDIGLSGLERSLANRREFGNALRQQRLDNNTARLNAIREAFLGATPEDAATLRLEADKVAKAYLPDIKRAKGAATERVVKSLDRMANSVDFRNFPEAERFLGAVRHRLVRQVAPEERVSAARGLLQDFLATPRRGSSAAHQAMLEARRIVISGQREGLSPDDIIAQLRTVKGATAQGQATLSHALKVLKTTELGKPDVASLYNARKYVTQELMPRLSGQTMRAARSFLRKLDDEIVKVAPGFKQYLKEYAAAERVAQQAEVGAEVIRRSAGAASEQLSPEMFARAVQDPTALVRKVTGFRRAKASRALTPEQRATLQNVRGSLQREQFAQQAARRGMAGADTAQNILGALDLEQALGRKGAAAARRAPAIGTAIEVLEGVQKRHGDKVMAVVQEAMLNPERARQIFARLPSAQRRAVLETLARLTAPVTAQAAAQPRLPAPE